MQRAGYFRKEFNKALRLRRDKGLEMEVPKGKEVMAYYQNVYNSLREIKDLRDKLQVVKVRDRIFVVHRGVL